MTGPFRSEQDSQADCAAREDPSAARATMVVGMHRSGTSFLTGTLQQYGLELGEHSTWNPHNTRGNRENKHIMQFHEALLAARGRAWNDPPEGTVTWTGAERAQARAIVDGYAGAAHWGFKDPRSLLFVEEWLALLPRPGLVGIFRHPLAVARSLKTRGFSSIEDAVALWQHYNRRLLELHRRRPFAVFSFEEPPETLLAKIETVAHDMGLTRRVTEPFFASELRHQEAGDASLPADVEATLRALREIAL